MKDSQKNLKSMNDFLLLLVMSYVVSQLKLLSMSWYRNMKPFLTNLKLVIEKYLCIFPESFLKIDCSSNDLMLSELGKYIYSYNFNSISFGLYIFFLLKFYVKC